MEYSQYFTITNNTNWEEYNKAVHCHPAYLTSIHSASYEMLDESQAGIKIARRSSILRYAENITLMAESEEELKSLLMRVKESEEAGLKLSFQKLRSWHPVPSLHGK